MPKNLQIFLLKENLGENKDLIDFESEVDSELNYNENYNNIKAKIDLLKQNKQSFEYKPDIKHIQSNMERYNNQLMKNETALQLDKILKKNTVIGVAGNRNTGKTMMVLEQLRLLRAEYPTLHIAVLGINTELKGTLCQQGITFLESKMDILDLKMRDTVIFIDEFAMLFDTRSQTKQLDKLMRFFDRIEHQNCKLIISTAREGYYNKFMCSRINGFMVKEIDYAALVNGTWLKERVMAINSSSDYRLEMGKDEYYTVITDELTQKHTYKYNPQYDTKKTNKDLFKKGE